MKLNKLAVMACAMAPFFAMAEGESGSGAGDMTTAATQVGSQISSGFQSVIGSLTTPVTAVILGGLGIWLIFSIVKIFKRAWNRSA